MIHIRLPGGDYERGQDQALSSCLRALLKGFKKRSEDKIP